MKTDNKRISRVCLIGGSGFVGRHLVSRLSKAGYQVRVLTRRSVRHRELRVLPGVEVVDCNAYNESALEKQFSDFLGPQGGAVINLVGILNQGRRPGRRFRDAHVALPQTIVNACLNTGVCRVLHMSALNADPEGPSKYLRSKGRGEAIMLGTQGLDVTVFRPSVIFGHDDAFFNRFARLLAMTPLVFPLACAGARFAPVFVEDVAAAFVAALDRPDSYGQSYELCGPRSYTLQQLVEYTARLSGHRRLIIGLGNTLSRLQGVLMEYLPGKPFSRDNYLSSTIDSVCSTPFPAGLGVSPQAIESIVPGYLGRRDPNSRFNRLRRHAARDS